MGGEKNTDFVSLFVSLGSPPRGRGKEIGVIFVEWRRGITPAWAGKSFIVILSMRSLRDHPRVGGEKRQLQHGRHQRLGSPPRGRGKVPGRSQKASGRGITPAWAGKSGCAGRKCRHPADHPRVGGEKLAMILVACTMLGSPPRGRGKGKMALIKKTRPRITPAWAGKSCIPCTRRFCGQGSPPRGRGKVLAALMPENRLRITPAWAGKSGCMMPAFAVSGDHPRVGGEKRASDSLASGELGSPPRGRGKGGKLPGRVRADGITPAWAGKRAGH